MYRLTILTHFASAHNLRNYQGECENLHGHNWKVEVTVAAHELDKAGLAIDFKLLKARTKEVLPLLDHKYPNEIPPFDTLSPSSENISRFLFERLGAVLDDGNVTVERITVWESEYACASYSLD